MQSSFKKSPCSTCTETTNRRHCSRKCQPLREYQKWLDSAEIEVMQSSLGGASYRFLLPGGDD